MGKGVRTLPRRLRLRLRAFAVAVPGFLGAYGHRMVLVLMTGLGLVITSVAAASALDRKDVRAALVVGMTLLIIGVFGDRISEFTAKWGDKELAVKVIDEAGKRIERLSSDEATPEPLRKELRELGTDVEVARRLTEASGEPRRRAQHWAAWHPEHLVATTGDVLLKLTGPSDIGLAYPRRFRCTVTSAQGVSVSAVREPSVIGMASASGFGRTTIEFRWPDEFAGALPVGGKFYVTWSTASTVVIGLLPDEWTDVAFDAFAV